MSIGRCLSPRRNCIKKNKKKYRENRQKKQGTKNPVNKRTHKKSTKSISRVIITIWAEFGKFFWLDFAKNRDF